MAIQQIGNLATYASQAMVATPRPAAAKRSESAEVPLSGQPTPQPSDKQYQEAVQAVQHAVEPVARNLQFSIDKETGKTIISVVDAVTKEVIRQIPGEEILAIAKAIDRMQGLLLKLKA